MFKAIASVIIITIMIMCGLGMTYFDDMNKPAGTIACFCGMIACMGAMIIIMEI